MSVFKMNIGLVLETAKARNKASMMMSDYKKPSLGKISGLKTASKFVSEESDINKLMKKYKKLVNKDMDDVDKMVLESIAADAQQKTKWSNSSGKGGDFGGGGGGSSF
ncbi:hypothetical protein SAMN02910369_01608 [Lachnospiraceae bacterium NE2001]|nr:hypothetical protein SAMN02910369_01608 [Lachnospiraceae bacterium NE2001]